MILPLLVGFVLGRMTAPEYAPPVPRPPPQPVRWRLCLYTGCGILGFLLLPTALAWAWSILRVPGLAEWLGEYAVELAILAAAVVAIRRRLTRQATMVSHMTGGTQ